MERKPIAYIVTAHFPYDGDAFRFSQLELAAAMAARASNLCPDFSYDATGGFHAVYPRPDSLDDEKVVIYSLEDAAAVLMQKLVELFASAQRAFQLDQCDVDFLKKTTLLNQGVDGKWYFIPCPYNLETCMRLQEALRLLWARRGNLALRKYVVVTWDEWAELAFDLAFMSDDELKQTLRV